MKGPLWAAHDVIRDQLWTHARSVRRWRRPRAVIGRRVLHVTTSFDVGGSQMQIRHLCTASGTRFDHRATEIFPEDNFLYRAGVTLDAARHVRGGPVGRGLGRMVLSRSRRGSHLIQIRKLADDFRHDVPDVVVGWGHEVCIVAFIAAALARVPRIVFCIRTLNPTFGWTNARLASLLRAAHRNTASTVSRVITNSTLLRRDHAAWAGIDGKRIDVCANGIDIAVTGDPAVARARMRRTHGIPDEAIVISNVGRFGAEKGQMSMVEAGRLVREQAPAVPIVWVLCGDGATRDAVRARAREQQLDNVIFTGRTASSADVLAGSDMFVMPSDYEGMPNAMMEAMAAGLPCISTRVSGVTDVARDGIEAEYYDARDAAALAARVLDLTANRERAREMGHAAAERMRAFSVPAFVRCFEDAIERTV